MNHSLKTPRFLAVCVLLAAVAVMAACGSSDSGTVRIDESKDGQTIEMKSGGTLIISLPSNPTTGYGWTVSDPTGGLEQQGDPAYTPQAGSTAVVGGGGTQVLTFKAGSKGQYKLGLAYVRSFEPNAAPADTFNITVTVK
ncbi:MAG: protease inhibitor I42 family protein [Dehalococcoidia bacterium]